LITALGRDIVSKVKVVLGGADISQFRPLGTPRELKSVIYVARFAERKRPDLILRTVQNNSSFLFTMHGKGWEKTHIFDSLKSCNNFKYFDFNFKNSNVLLNKSNIFLSLSDNEGAPMPALEALAAGCKVILTDTGFARDLEQISDSVIVIPVNPSPYEVTLALNKSLNLPNPPLDIVNNFKYENFLRELSSI
jgi:glycosyltransferase involved in cell wall biosynthesis